MTWAETKANISADATRVELLIFPGGGSVWYHPSFWAALFYRFSHFFYERDRRLAARFFWQLNILITGADIAPSAELGPGLLLVTPSGVSIFGRAGRNLTLMPCSGLGGEVGRREDVGASPGLPWLGDDVTLEPHSGVLGPVRIGNRVRISGGVYVISNVPDDTIVSAHRIRILKDREPN